MLYKKQVIYAISRLFEMYDTDSANFIFSKTTPSLQIETFKHKLLSIHKPENDTEIEVSVIPSYAFRLNLHTFSADDKATRLSTLEKLFKLAYNQFAYAYYSLDEDADSLLLRLTDEYLENNA